MPPVVEMDTKPELSRRENYLAMVKNSVGSTAFRNVHAEAEGKKVDLTRDGADSCAYFIACVLRVHNTLAETHVTVEGTERDMRASGWVATGLAPEDLPPGAVVVWEHATGTDGLEHEHMGFVVGDGRAVSNSTKGRAIAEHELDFQGRRIVRAYTHPRLV